MSSTQPVNSKKSRQHDRAAIQIDVAVVGVLESFDAVISDLSEGGALIVGGSLPHRARCEIRYGEQVVYALVMWSEVDRMGVRFPYELRDGPLHQLLTIARNHNQPRPANLAPRPSHGFGRRGL